MRANKDNFSSVVKKIQNFKFKGPDDLHQMMCLSDSVFDEWWKLREKFRKHLMRDRKSILKSYEIFEAEEQLVVGLLVVLNDELVNYINRCDPPKRLTANLFMKK